MLPQARMRHRKVFMETKPDTIKVSANHREEIFASHANLFVTVKGSSVVSGNEAMKKAKEVNQLVEALTRFGLSPDAVQLQGVRIETASGVLLKSSSAIYRLKVRCEKLDQLADLLDITASQKNATLEQIEWKYPEESAQEHGLESAIAIGKAKAEKSRRQWASNSWACTILWKIHLMKKDHPCLFRQWKWDEITRRRCR